jgi:hypothetical protein
MGCVGVVNDSDDGGAVDAEGERDADIWEGVDEVYGAVDGIADESWSVGEFLAWDVGFLAEEAL